MFESSFGLKVIVIDYNAINYGGDKFVLCNLLTHSLLVRICALNGTNLHEFVIKNHIN